MIHDDLIARLESATEGSRELDAEVALATGVGNFNKALQYMPANVAALLDAEECGQGAICCDECGAISYGERLFPEFTTSLDSALTLAPEGMEFELTNVYGVARCTMGINAEADTAPWYGVHWGGSLPLALCAAALRARLAAGEQALGEMSREELE